MYKNLIEHSQSFVLVIEYNGFANAARKKNVCPSVISNHIIALEQYLGKKLLYRTTRRVQLTQEGEAYFHYARNFLKQAAEAKNIIHALDREPHGVLRLAIPNFIKRVLVNDALGLFMEKYPKIAIEICIANDLSLVSTDLVDVAISTSDNDDIKLIGEVLSEGEWGVFASPDYIMRLGKPKSVQELQQHNCLIDKKVSPQHEWVFAKAKKVKVNGNYITDNGEDALEMALQGVGLFWVPVCLVQPNVDKGQLVAIKNFLPPKTFSFQLCYKPASYGSNVRLFVEFMKSYYQKQTLNAPLLLKAE